MSPARYRAALAVALATTLVALFLRYESARFEATGSPSSCHIAESAVFDCDAVQTSKYAKFLGVSLATWGGLGGATLFCWLLASRRATGFLVMAGIAAAVGACAVLYTATVSWFLLGKVCLYCSAMQAGFLGLAILVVPPAWRARAVSLPRRPFLLGGTTAAVLLALALSGEAYAQESARLQRIFEPSTKGLRLDVSDTLVLGSPDTRVSVVLFVDFGCPACRECTRKAAELVKKYPASVHFRLKHYPLDKECNRQLPSVVHVSACRAALAAQAAQEAGKGAEAVPLVFEHQDDGFSKAVLARIGQELGVPAAKWAENLGSATVQAIRDRDIAEGNELGLRQVPVAFVNGQWVDTSRLEETISKLCSR
ncbi:MAG TPA: thioredoxin domain-containing protein [Planctomycetota bacterium]|nr:thioredoxin domain-containing protein [Planctomycetota bacterium]